MQKLTKHERSIIEEIRARQEGYRPHMLTRLWRPASSDLAACHRLQAKGLIRQERNGVRRLTGKGASL